MSTGNAKKIGKSLADIVVYVFLAVCIFTVVVTVLAKKDVDGAATVFGYQMRVVTSDSMGASEFTDVSEFKVKDIPIRSMVFVKIMPDNPERADNWYRKLQVGDVLTFRYVYTTQVTITHRIISITEKPSGGFVIELAGDNKNSEDGQLTQIIDTSIPNNTNYVIGKVVGQSYAVGVAMTFLQKPVAIVLLIMIPCLVIIFIEAIKIMRILNADKKQKEQDEKIQKDNELEELRRKLAALENQALNDAADQARTKSERDNDTEG